MQDEPFYIQFADKMFNDGLPIHLITLTNKNKMSITLMDIGATWLRCQLPLDTNNAIEKRDVVLFAKNFSAHEKQSAYLGATIGPYANRIKNALYRLNDKTFHLVPNEGKHALHGGLMGLHQLRWRIMHQSTSLAIFAIDSEIEGFARPIRIEASYELTEENTVIISFKAHTHEDTYLNLTNHAYFNLAGIYSNYIAHQHALSIKAEQYLEVDDESMPIAIRDVQDTEFDLNHVQALSRSYDHAFILTKDLPAHSPQIEIISPDKLISLAIHTTKPCVQFYTADFLNDAEGPRGFYPKSHGLAIEPQYIPNGPNHPEWTLINGLLKAGEYYSHKTCYHFKIQH